MRSAPAPGMSKVGDGSGNIAAFNSWTYPLSVPMVTRGGPVLISVTGWVVVANASYGGFLGILIDGNEYANENVNFTGIFTLTRLCNVPAGPHVFALGLKAFASQNGAVTLYNVGALGGFPALPFLSVQEMPR